MEMCYIACLGPYNTGHKVSRENFALALQYIKENYPLNTIESRAAIYLKTGEAIKEVMIIDHNGVYA